jgi:hypothetical protein
MLGVPIVGCIPVSGTRLLFLINGGTGRLGNDANLGAFRRSFARADDSVGHGFADAATNRPSFEPSR